MGYFIGPMPLQDFMDYFLRPSTDESQMPPVPDGSQMPQLPDESQMPVPDESQMPQVPDDLFAGLATATEAQSYLIVVS